jgi:hypothetical protein
MACEVALGIRPLPCCCKQLSPLEDFDVACKGRKDGGLRPIGLLSELSTGRFSFSRIGNDSVNKIFWKEL